ncbi:uncharacterized protein LOC143462617 [Clavelina lepadiformis]|uniref:Uncharacterized protein n=1 Tax=Clavelina lepadiformis TaxID=159417 RepID=A0ABP0GLR8_CLALP
MKYRVLIVLIASELLFAGLASSSNRVCQECADECDFPVEGTACRDCVINRCRDNMSICGQHPFQLQEQCLDEPCYTMHMVDTPTWVICVDEQGKILSNHTCCWWGEK